MDAREAFEEAARHFPRWMDIRKRQLSSAGGKFLYSILAEIAEIEKERIQFEKGFFLKNYLGREHEIIDYLFAAQVGEVELEKFDLEEPAIPVTGDLKTFYESESPMSHYQQGYLFLKAEDAKGLERIVYRHNGYRYSAKLEKTHVWNVFDEFALFAGIRRYPDETNEELARRTLAVFQNRPNSSEEGLKNAIRNALINVDDLKPEEIRIERPNEDNLYKIHNGKPVIDELAELNKDTYRTKVWDRSKWEHPFKKLAFTPHEWDKKLEAIQDGVGHNDSLKTYLLSELDKDPGTNVQIDLYKKSSVKINEYIRQNRLNGNIELTLVKYKNELKPKEIEYRIKATDVKDITSTDIVVESYQSVRGTNKYYIEDLVLNEDDIQDAIVARNRIEKNKHYKLRFYPKREFDTMKIAKADVLEGGQKVSLLKEKGAYRFNAQGELVNTNVKLHAKSRDAFLEYRNIRDVEDGVTLEDAAQDGSFVVDLSGCENQYLHIGHSSEETNIIQDSTLVQYTGFTLNESGELESQKGAGEIVIDTVCNTLRYEMLEGNCLVAKTIDGVDQAPEIWYEQKEETLSFDRPTRVTVRITKINQDLPCRVRNIRYSHYEVKYRLLKGDFIRSQFGLIVPNIPNNQLEVRMRTFHGYAPVVHYVHAGSSLKNAVYETELFSPKEDAKLDIDSDCIVELAECRANGSVIQSVKPYVTKALYKNQTDSPVFIEIDTSRFREILSSAPRIERFSYEGRIRSFIRLGAGEELDSITVEGSTLKLLERKSVQELAGLKSGEELYANKELKALIAKGANTERLVRIERQSFDPRANLFRVQNMPEGLNACFVADEDSNVEVVSSEFDRSFKSLYFFPADGAEHIAYNRYSMVKPKAENIDLVNLFTPPVPEGKLMAYTIDRVTNSEVDATVLFMKEDGDDFWSLGVKPVVIEADFETGLSENYEQETVHFKKRILISNMIDLAQEIGKNIDLAEYIVIPPDGMKIVYETKESDEEIYIVEEDRFTKLKYANIDRILELVDETGKAVPEHHYTLLKEEGILVWNTDEYIATDIFVKYLYKVPRYLAFKDLESLYKLAGYSIDAYQHEGTLYFEHLAEDMELDDRDREAIDGADRIIVSSSNPNWRVQYENGVLKLSRSVTEDRIVLKGGYFYQDGAEYYHFVNRSEEVLERLEHIDLIRTKRIFDTIHFSQRSTNRLPNSSMIPDRLAETSYFDFRNVNKLNGVSSLGALTASDQIHLWNAFEAEISFAEGYNGTGLEFRMPKEESYCFMELTDFIFPGALLSLHKTGDMELWVTKEITHEGLPFQKSVFMKPLESLIPAEGFYNHIFKKETFDEESRYFLVVKGNGVIDDLVITLYQSHSDIKNVHEKPFKKMGFTFKEQEQPGFIQTLLFDTAKNVLSGLEIDEYGYIRTGSTIDWGLTKIYDLKEHMSEIALREADLIKGEYVKSYDKPARLEINAVYVPNKDTVKELVIKINDCLFDFAESFTVDVYGSNSKEGVYQHVFRAENTNVAAVPHHRLFSYMRIVVEMPPAKIINALDVYAAYRETNKAPGVIPLKRGHLITKVHDLGAEKHVRILKLLADDVKHADQIAISVRAARQKDDRIVWTNWTKLKLDDNLCAVNSPEYEQYRFFQFKIDMNHQDALLKLRAIQLEVID